MTMTVHIAGAHPGEAIAQAVVYLEIHKVGPVHGDWHTS